MSGIGAFILLSACGLVGTVFWIMLTGIGISNEIATPWSLTIGLVVFALAALIQAR